MCSAIILPRRFVFGTLHGRSRRGSVKEDSLLSRLELGNCLTYDSMRGYFRSVRVVKLSWVRFYLFS